MRKISKTLISSCRKHTIQSVWNCKFKNMLLCFFPW